MAPWTLIQSYNHLAPPPQKPPMLSLIPITLAFVTSFTLLLYSSFHFDMTFSLHTKTSPSSSSSPIIPFLEPNSNNKHFDNPGSLAPMNQRRSGIEVVSSLGTSLQNATSRKVGNDEFQQQQQQHDSVSNIPPIQGPEELRYRQPYPCKQIEDDKLHVKNVSVIVSPNTEDQLPITLGTSAGSSKSKHNTTQDVLHDKEIFLKNYIQMKRNLKVYIYHPNKNDPFTNVFLPQKDQTLLVGNYASEAYFKNLLFESHFVTTDPSEADLFFLPFSIASLRQDHRVGVSGLQDFVTRYMMSITREYPYWNRTGGADHFYVACHSIGRMAMEKVEQVKSNAIQVVCSSSYFLPYYFAHKDVSLPQIWPRHVEPPNLANTTKRKRLAFFAGAMNSPVRKAVLRSWKNDSSIFAHEGRLKTPYSKQLLKSKYCLHLKGFEVNTARVADALYYGCVPVILADHYDLPFMDILNWRRFSVVVATSDIPQLKKILEEISPREYSILQANVLKVRRHFQWNAIPHDFDAFYMVMYELWLRRSSIRIMS